MAHPACLVCFISTVYGRIKKPWRPGARSGHMTNLKQSIFRLFIYIYACKPDSKVDQPLRMPRCLSPKWLSTKRRITLLKPTISDHTNLRPAPPRWLLHPPSGQLRLAHPLPHLRRGTQSTRRSNAPSGTSYFKFCRCRDGPPNVNARMTSCQKVKYRWTGQEYKV